MAITHEETMLAIRISQIIQDYFEKNKINITLKTSEVYELLYKNGVSNWDKNSASKFRDFLKKLAANNSLELVPQCRSEMSGRSTTWYFESAPHKTIRARKLVPLVKKEAERAVEVAQ